MMKKGFVSLSLIILFVVFAVISLLVTYQLSSRANNIVREGDRLVAEEKYAQALEKYEEGVRKWPLLRFTSSYKNRVTFAEGLIEFYQQVPTVAIFLEDETSQENIDTFTKQLELISGFDRVEFLTKQEAHAKYEERVSGEQVEELFGFISADDMFLTIEVYLDEPSLAWKIVQLAESKDFVFQAVEID